MNDTRNYLEGHTVIVYDLVQDFLIRIITYNNLK